MSEAEEGIEKVKPSIADRRLEGSYDNLVGREERTQGQFGCEG